jgi:hypothetical protein
MSSLSVALSRSGPRKAAVALKGTVLIEHHTGCDEAAQGRVVCEQRRPLSVFRQVHHDARHHADYASRNALCFKCRAKTSMNWGSLLAPHTASV